MSERRPRWSETRYLGAHRRCGGDVLRCGWVWRCRKCRQRVETMMAIKTEEPWQRQARRLS